MHGLTVAFQETSQQFFRCDPMKILGVVLAAISAAWGQSAYSGLSTSAGAATWPTAATTVACGPPNYACSRSDTTTFVLSNTNPGTKHPPLLAAAGQSTACGGGQCWGGKLGAGVVASDPDNLGTLAFCNNNRMLRVTDYATDVAGRSYFTDSSAELPQINLDGTAFRILEKSNACMYSFDRSIWNSVSCAAGATNCQAARKQFCVVGSNPIPSSFVFGTTATDALAMYVFNDNSQRIERWLLNKAANPWSVAIDQNWPTADANGADVTANCLRSLMTPWATFGGFAVNGDSTRFTAEIREFDGAQNEGGLIVVFDKTKGCKYLNLRRGVATDWNGTTEHAVSVSGLSPLGPPSAAAATAVQGGSLISGHTYAVQYSYTLRNPNGVSDPTPADIGETNGSAITTVAMLCSGCNAIALTAPGTPAASANGMQIDPTGYNVFACDRTANPGCTPTMQTVDGAPQPAGDLTCTVAAGNSGTNFTYTYYVAARSMPGLSSSSNDVSCTLQTAAAIGSSLPNTVIFNGSLSADAAFPTTMVYEVFRNARDSRVLRSGSAATADFTCTGTVPNTTCTFTDKGSLGPRAVVLESVNGTGNGAQLSVLSMGGVQAYSGLQATSGDSTHNAKLDLSGGPVVITGTAIGENLGVLAGKTIAFWYPDETASCNPAVQTCPLNPLMVIPCPTLCGGHRVDGYGVELREPASSSPLDFRFAAPEENTTLVKAVDDTGCANDANCRHFSQHLSWANAAPGLPYKPPFTGTYTSILPAGAGAGHWPTGLYSGELLTIPMDAGKRPLRMGMLYSNGDSGGLFFGTPRCAVAPLGDYALCSSNYQYWNTNPDGSAGYGGFGDGNGNQTCDPTLNPNTSTSGCRIDVILFELR